MVKKKLPFEIGRRIKALREKKGLRQKDIAHALGLTPGFISGLESAKKSLKLDHLIKIAEILEVPLSELFSEEDSSKREEPRPDSKASLRAISGSVGRERRAPWHPEARKNQFLKMAAYILECDHPELTPEFEKKILEVHTALLAPSAPKKVESA